MGVLLVGYKALVGHLLAVRFLETLPGPPAYMVASEPASPKFSRRTWLLLLAAFSWLLLTFNFLDLKAPGILPFPLY